MIEDRQGIARQNLLKEMRDLCFILTRKPWVPEFEFKLYQMVLGETQEFDGKALAPAFLSHIDALPDLSDEAGGWYTADNADSFVEWDAWEPKYEAWRAAK